MAQIETDPLTGGPAPYDPGVTDEPNFMTRAVIEQDKLDRWQPADTAIAHAKALLAAEPNADLAVIPMVQPGKNRGIWVLGQEVVTVPGVVILANADGGRGGVTGYPHARKFAELIAGAVQVEIWRQARDATGRLMSPGTTAHAAVYRDGNVIVTEDR